MNGHETDHDSHVWYRLKDEMTEQDKGYISTTGETRDTDSETARKVNDAFAKNLMVKDNEVVEELGGVCFDGVCTIGPSDPDHNQMVLRNLGALTGLRPEPTEENEEPAGHDGER